MAKVGAQRASTLTGRSKSTIQRAMKTGKLSYEVDDKGNKLIDTSELERVFGMAPEKPSYNNDRDLIEAELQRASQMLETERMKMRIKSLEDNLHSVSTQLEDMKEQRDQWQKQAQQVLLTNQHTQKQADDLKEELKERDRREREARQRMAEQRMRLQAQNQNSAAQQAGNESTLWEKLLKKVRAA